MSAQNNGGPAFPVLPPLGHDGALAAGYPYASEGMTLRDYFAAQALQCAMPNAWDFKGGPPAADLVAEITLLAYHMADAMLKARAEGGAA